MREELTLRQKISIGFSVAGLILLLIGIASFFGSDAEDYFDLFDEVYYGTYQSSEIKSVKIDIDYGDVVILNGSEFQLKIDNVDKENFKMELVNNVLSIRYDVPVIDSIYMNKGDGAKTRFELVLPNKMYEELNLDVFNGSLNIKGVSCNELVLNSKMTDTDFEKVNINQSATIDLSLSDFKAQSCMMYSPQIICGNGYTHIMKSTLNNLKLEGAMGDVNIASCLLSGSSRIEGGSGDINILLSGSKESYGFSFLSGNKDVTVDSQSYKDYDGKTSDNNILVDSGHGEIAFKFN